MLKIFFFIVALLAVLVAALQLQWILKTLKNDSHSSFAHNLFIAGPWLGTWLVLTSRLGNSGFDVFLKYFFYVSSGVVTLPYLFILLISIIRAKKGS